MTAASSHGSGLPTLRLGAAALALADVAAGGAGTRQRDLVGAGSATSQEFHAGSNPAAAAPTVLADWLEACGFASLADAKRHVGDADLSSPGKMPCHSYGLPAAECNVGSKLRRTEGSVCASCYALKGNYVWEAVQAAQYRRLASLADPRWTDAMVCLIGWRERRTSVFRWHDSGDIQSLDHLSAMAEVCRRLPWVRFWCPTRELGQVRQWRATYGPLPSNLSLRLSAAMVGYFTPIDEALRRGECYSNVARHGQEIPAGAHECPAYRQDGHCGDCRACWSTDVPVVVYPLH